MQVLWPSRSRLNSGRTVSESSEGCGTVVDMEMSEDFSMSGSLKRHRNRQDSAYMSQRDSMSGGPPETPSPDMEEEDQNGYVLPGDSPKRGSSIIWCLLGLFRKERLQTSRIIIGSSWSHLCPQSLKSDCLTVYPDVVLSSSVTHLSFVCRYPNFHISRRSCQDREVSFVQSVG